MLVTRITRLTSNDYVFSLSFSLSLPVSNFKCTYSMKVLLSLSVIQPLSLQCFSLLIWESQMSAGIDKKNKMKTSK